MIRLRDLIDIQKESIFQKKNNSEMVTTIVLRNKFQQVIPYFKKSNLIIKYFQ